MLLQYYTNYPGTTLIKVFQSKDVQLYSTFLKCHDYYLTCKRIQMTTE
jgi:hypothetical protein